MSAQNSLGQKAVSIRSIKKSKVDDRIVCVRLSTVEELKAYFASAHSLGKNLLFRLDGQVLQYIKHNGEKK